MKNNPPPMRGHMQCGYMPAEERRVIPGLLPMWTPDSMELTVCAGYSTTLPDVIDAAKNYHHYDTGQLATACNGGPPTLLFDLCAMLKSAVLSKDAYRMREQAKKNGGNGGR